MLTSFIKIARSILRATNKSEIDKILAEVETLDQQNAKKEKTANSHTEQRAVGCEQSAIQTLYLLCQLRIYSRLDTDELQHFNDYCKNLANWKFERSKLNEYYPRDLYMMHNYTLHTVLALQCLVIPSRLGNIDQLLEAAFEILLETRYLQLYKREFKDKSEILSHKTCQRMENSIDINARDMKPQSAEDEYIYGLARLVLNKLFTAYAQLCKEQRETNGDELTALRIKYKIDFINFLVTQFNLHEFPEVRARLKRESDLQDLKTYKEGLTSLKNEFRLLMEMSHQLFLINHEAKYNTTGLRVTIDEMKTYLLYRCRYLTVFINKHIAALPEAIHLHFMEDTLRVLSTTIDFQSSYNIDITTYVSLDFTDHCVPAYGMLMAKRPNIMMKNAAETKSGSRYGELKKEFKALLQRVNGLKPESYPTCAKGLVEYYLLCVLASKTTADLAILLDKSTSATLTTLIEKAIPQADQGIYLHLLKHIESRTVQVDPTYNASTLMRLQTDKAHLAINPIILRRFAQLIIKAKKNENELAAYHDAIFDCVSQTYATAKQTLEQKLITLLPVNAYSHALSNDALATLENSADDLPTAATPVPLTHFFQIGLALLRSNDLTTLNTARQLLDSLPANPVIADMTPDVAAACSSHLHMLLKSLYTNRLIVLGELLSEEQSRIHAEQVFTLIDLNRHHRENWSLNVVYSYIALTTKIIQIIYARKDEEVINGVRNLLIDIYEMLASREKSAGPYAQPLLNGIENFITPTQQPDVFTDYTSELTCILLLHLFDMYNDVSISCKKPLHDLIILINRFNLSAYPEYQTRLTNHFASIAASINKSPTYVTRLFAGRANQAQLNQSITSLLQQFSTLDRAYGSVYLLENDQQRFNEQEKAKVKFALARRLSCIKFDTDLLLADAKWLALEGVDSKQQSSILQLLTYIVICHGKYYQSQFSGSLFRFSYGFNIDDIQFTDYMTPQIGFALADVMHKRVETLLSVTDNNLAERLNAFHTLSHELSLLLQRHDTCPAAVKSVVARFLMEFYIICMDAVCDKAEATILVPQFSKVNALVVSDIDKLILRICLKTSINPTTAEATHEKVKSIIELVNKLREVTGNNFKQLRMSAAVQHCFYRQLYWAAKHSQGSEMQMLDKLITQCKNQCLETVRTATNSCEKMRDTLPPLLLIEPVTKPAKPKTKPKAKIEKKQVTTKPKKIIAPVAITEPEDTASDEESSEASSIADESTTSKAQPQSNVTVAVIPDKETPPTREALTNNASTYRFLISRRHIKDTLIRFRLSQQHKMLKGFQMRFCTLHTPIVDTLHSLSANLYVFDDKVCATIYGVRSSHVSLLSSATQEAILDLIDTPNYRKHYHIADISYDQPNSTIRVRFDATSLEQSGIPYLETDMILTVHCCTTKNILGTMQRLCTLNPFNTTLFCEVTTGSVIDVTESYFAQLIVYPIINDELPQLNKSGYLDIQPEYSLAHDPATIVINAISKLSRYSATNFPIGVGQALHNYLLQHGHTLSPPPGMQYAVSVLDELFLSGRAAKSLQLLVKYQAVCALFPTLNPAFLSDAIQACAIIDYKLANRPLHLITTTEWRTLRAELLATMFYQSFMSTHYFHQPLTPELDEQMTFAVHKFFAALPFAIGDRAQLDAITMIMKRYQCNFTGAATEESSPLVKLG